MEEFLSLNVDGKFVEEAVIQEIFIQSGQKSTICVLMLNTGFEVVGTFTATTAPADVTEGKEKSRESAISKATEYFIQLDSWRFALYNAEKAMKEQREQQEAAAEGKEKTTPAPKMAKS